jgi:hypothetical protein
MSYGIVELTVVHHNAEPIQAIKDAYAARAAAAEQQFVNEFIDMLAGFAAGTRLGRITSRMEDGTNATASSATITCDQSEGTVGDTLTIGGQTLTVVAAAPTEGTEFLLGASDAENATNLAACINANAALKGIVVASAAAAVVTLTFGVAGRLGNLITLAKNVTNAGAYTLSGAVLSGATSVQAVVPRTYAFGGVG